MICTVYATYVPVYSFDTGVEVVRYVPCMLRTSRYIVLTPASKSCDMCRICYVRPGI